MDHPVVAPADQGRLYWFSEAQWRQIEAVFPRPNGKKGFAQEVPNRQACEAVLFRARTGCPWRDLPAAYGPWHTIYMRWRRWVDAGVPERAAQAILAARQGAGDFDPALALLDSTVVRAHQHAAGARKKNRRRASGPGPLARGPFDQNPPGGRRRAYGLSDEPERGASQRRARRRATGR